MNNNLSAWVFVILASLNTCIANILLKQSRLVVYINPLAQFFSPWFLGSLFFYGINVLIFAKALDKLAVSVAYPVFAATGFVFLNLAANVFFGERLGLNQLIGIILIIVGIQFLAKQT